MEFTDNRGPYATLDECKARVEEMVNDIMPTLPPVPVSLYYKCKRMQSV